ncbi:hypothetical protein BH23GEM2_BH23GEM2_24960 [soil metagenome]
MKLFSLVQVVIGAAFVLAALAAPRLVSLNLWPYRKAGLSGLAIAWERRLAWWTRTVTVVAAALALAFLMMGFGILRSD